MSLTEIRERKSDPEAFFERDVPDIHGELRPYFSALSDVPVRFHIDFRALDAAYTVELRSDGCRVEAGTMIDFPVVSLRTDVTEWKVIRRHTFELLEIGRELFEERVELEQVSTLDGGVLQRFESFDGIIDLALSFPELDRPLESELVLNDYEPFGEPGRFELKLDVEALYRVARGEASPAEVVKGGQLRGDLSLAFNLGGFLLQEFPELSE